MTNAVEHCNEGDERMDRDVEVGKHTVQEGVQERIPLVHSPLLT